MSEEAEKLAYKIADTINADNVYFVDELLAFLHQHKLIKSFEEYLDNCQKEGDYVWCSEEKIYFIPDKFE